VGILLQLPHRHTFLYMLKQLTAAILLLAFMASSFCRTVIVLDYFANTTAYAKSCINKARLNMHCNGKCQMMKKLEQEEKNDQENLERKAENKKEKASGGGEFLQSGQRSICLACTGVSRY